MAFDELAILPDNYSRDAVALPTFSTVVVEGSTGDEQRVVEWAQPRRRYEIAYGTRPPAQIAALRAFFLARQGRARGFRFRDVSDFQLSGEATAPLTATTFQIQKTYDDGSGTTHARPIYKPDAATIQVFVSGSPVVSGYTLDDSAGVLTFGSAPGATPTVTGNYFVPVRFDSDTFRSVQHSPGSLSYESVTLIELRQSS